MTIIIDPQSSGISGNMIIGALADLGADEIELKNIMESVTKEFGEINVEFKKINKKGIASTYCNVEMIEKSNVYHYDEFIDKIKNLDIENKIITKSIAVFERIALAESKVHGTALQEVHFHEVGASDAVADVIGAIYAYYTLNLDKEKIIGLPVAVGGGQVKTMHGMLPVPAPATLEILKGVECIGGPISSELATPTGCALYMEFCDEIKEFLPATKPLKIAYGAGSKDFDHPNVLRIIQSSEEIQTDSIDVIETNIDHLTGEELGYLFDKLFAEGALDVSITPILMKKNRQGSLLKVISKEENREHLLNTIFKETGSLGIRILPNIHRGIAKREFETEKIEIEGEEFEITYKIGYLNNEIISKRAEFEDLKKIAVKTGLPLKDIKKIIK